MAGLTRCLVLRGFLAVALLAAASACSKSGDSSALASVSSPTSPTTTTPTTSTTTPTTPTTTVETFTGSFAQGSYAVHPFTQTARGTLIVTLTDVGPDNTLVVGVGVGTWDGTNCSLISGAFSDAAKIGWTVTGTATAANFCAAIYDTGNVPTDSTVTYTITVEHS